ncbi:hypothetical protein GR160_02630 [Flavobacterium sp. Sd200]|uniref:YdeI/OmpD-associated family protein n=1 Tax=Flavobacterium sp. Sd200 TaxID=2692211 RepID=UPI00136CA26F|nr:DUF1801 domain-containing protein [Flavobacterium sp. Sd200]MXN90110.1 hypothetical protein [Flavobacterium sp. Sd200]
MEKKNTTKVWDKTNQWEKELEALKAIIAKTELTETTKWGGTTYTYNNKNVIGIGGFKNFFTIWFYKGVFLKDEANVLINANEENTKSLRQWRFTSLNDINEKAILHYINEAIEVEKAGLAIAPQKKELIVPEILLYAFKNIDGLENAFNNFSPYKQKEFCEFIAEAKQEKTKIARLEKIKPMLLSGVGLNDKYR